LRAAVLGLCALLAGCAAAPRIAGLDVAAGAELEHVPFFPDDTDQCGPAALATVLAASGVPATPEALRPLLYVPARGGSLQAEMVAAARRHERVAYRLRADPAALLDTVASGTPVLVLQNLGLSWWPRWHYAVVVGFDAAADTVVLRSGRERRAVMPMRGFMRSWERAGTWALAVVAPSAPPPRAEPAAWLDAASAFEELGQPRLAAQAYEAATRRWGEQALPWQALANARYALGDLAGAEAALHAALAREPGAAALNNLAHVQLARGCVAAARVALAHAGSLPASAAEREVLERTAAAVAAHRGPRRDCVAYAPPR
jgi:tetratricopeptide (TPR) repeat protein